MKKECITSGWWNKFLKRQGDLSLRHGDSTAHVHMDAINRETIGQYFSLLKNVLDEHNLAANPEQISSAAISKYLVCSANATTSGIGIGRKSLPRARLLTSADSLAMLEEKEKKQQDEKEQKEKRKKEREEKKKQREADMKRKAEERAKKTEEHTKKAAVKAESS